MALVSYGTVARERLPAGAAEFARHAVHGPPWTGLYQLARHAQAAADVLAGGEEDCSAHAAHAPGPAPALKLPAGHAAHRCSVSSPAWMRRTTSAISVALSRASTA